MLAVPPAILESAGLSAGSRVGVSIDGGRLVVEPDLCPRYTLEELLLEHEKVLELSPVDREWLESPAAGRELL
jgi:antitoxin ChpS